MVETIARLPPVTEAGQMVPTWLTKDDFAEWDRFVASVPSAFPYQLSCWGRFLDGVAPYLKQGIFALRDRESGRLRAGLPFSKSISFLRGRRSISSPFATLGGVVADSEEARSILLENLTRPDTGRELGRLELRGLRPEYEGLQSQMSLSRSHLHHYLRLPEDPDELIGRCSRLVRRSVAKAEGAGVQVGEDRSVIDSGEFTAIHERSRRRLGLPVFPRSFFESLIAAFPEGMVRVDVARQEGQTVAALLSLEFGDWSILEHAANTPMARDVGASHLLYWTSIQRGIKQGRRFCSLGRTAHDNQGLLQFKRSWKGEEEVICDLAFPRNGPASGKGASNRVARLAFGRMPKPLARFASHLFYRYRA